MKKKKDGFVQGIFYPKIPNAVEKIQTQLGEKKVRFLKIKLELNMIFDHAYDFSTYYIFIMVSKSWSSRDGLSHY